MWRSLTRLAVRASKEFRSSGWQGAIYTAGRQHWNWTHKALNSSRYPSGFGALLGLTVTGTMYFPVAFASSKQEKSFIMVKPDGVHRGLISEIIKRFEDKGYKLVAIKILVPSKELAAQHYAEHEGKPFYPGLVDFLSSGAVVAMVWEGKDVIKYGRTLIGATNPLSAAPGTIRGDFGLDIGRNIIHGSDSVESSQKEISIWFSPEELADYTLALGAWTYE